MSPPLLQPCSSPDLSRLPIIALPLPNLLAGERLLGSASRTGPQFDLCFIDGDHGYGAVTHDYEQLAPHCGSAMFHDIQVPPRFYRLLSHLLAPHPLSAL